jgi:hypothetical protein
MVTYYVVQAFEQGRKGVLIADLPREARSPDHALAMGLRLAEAKAGVVVFSRSGDPSMGDWEDATVLAQHGLVPGDLMEMVG